MRPTMIDGPWNIGYTMDVHVVSSEYLGDDPNGSPQFNTVRSELGELLFQLKYRGDRAASATLARAAMEFVTAQRWSVDVVVPVPPTKVRSFQPLAAIAGELASGLGAQLDTTTLTKVKDTPELKNIQDLDERASALAGAFQVNGAALAGKRVLLIDDLYRSGASLREAAQTLRASAGTASIAALALTRTKNR